MKKKIAVIMLTLALAISTTACNNAEEPANKDSIESEEDTEPLKEELPEETENETSESNISDDIETEKVPSVEPTYEDGSTEKEQSHYPCHSLERRGGYCDPKRKGAQRGPANLLPSRLPGRL